MREREKICSTKSENIFGMMSCVGFRIEAASENKATWIGSIAWVRACRSKMCAAVCVCRSTQWQDGMQIKNRFITFSVRFFVPPVRAMGKMTWKLNFIDAIINFKPFNTFRVLFRGNLFTHHFECGSTSNHRHCHHPYPPQSKIHTHLDLIIGPNVMGKYTKML